MKKKSVYLNTSWAGYLLMGMGMVFLLVAIVIQFITPTTSGMDSNQLSVFRLVFLASFGLPAAILFLVGLGLLLNQRKRLKQEAELKLRGKRVQATNVTLESSNVQVNRQYQMHLTCTYRDARGNQYLFKSRMLRMNPIPFLGDEVTVYLEPEKMKPYFVDVEGSMESVYE